MCHRLLNDGEIFAVQNDLRQAFTKLERLQKQRALVEGKAISAFRREAEIVSFSLSALVANPAASPPAGGSS